MTTHPTKAATPMPVAGHQNEFVPFTSTSVRGFGILGDSNSDEYRADNNRGQEFGPTTLNWMEQLVLKRGLNFGPWGTRDEPRRTGYEYNWARSGATARSLIESGQHLGLAEQVAQDQVSHVFVWIGSNDFITWNDTYTEIYDGSLDDAAVQAKTDQIVADISLAVDTVLSAGEVKMVIITIPDIGLTPEIVLTYPNPAKRRRVTEAINKTNTGLKLMAQERDVPIVDVNAFAHNLLGRLDKSGRLNIGSQKINFLTKGNEPHHIRLEDKVGHPGTVASGLLANTLFIEPFNKEYELNIPPLTDAEILENAGISSNATSPSGCLSSLPFLAGLMFVLALAKQRR